MASWQTIPIFGSWFWPNGDLRPGTYKITSNTMVTSDIGGGVVLPQGLVKTGQLNIDESNGRPSFEYESPAVDDLDMFPQGFTISVEIVPEGSTRIKYVLQPSEDHLPSGIDLQDVLVPDTWPDPSPLLIVGVPSGVAGLNSSGQVVNAWGTVILPGGGGGGGSFLEHVQTSPSASWSVDHSFGRTPQVSVIVGDQVVIADVEHLSDRVIITHAAPTTGKVILT